MRFALHAHRSFFHFLIAFLFITFLALAMSDCPSLATPGYQGLVEAAVDDSEIVLVVMPKGDAAAGRVAFQRLSCAACHAVPRDPAIKPPDETSGPVLGVKKVAYSSGYEVTSILSPSHIVAFQYMQNKNASNMPDLTGDMSVKELIDILAYLRSLASK